MVCDGVWVWWPAVQRPTKHESKFISSNHLHNRAEVRTMIMRRRGAFLTERAISSSSKTDDHPFWYIIMITVPSEATQPSTIN